MTAEQINSLYFQFNEYLLRHFEFFWAIIIGIFAIIGVALYFIAKSMVEKGIEKNAEKQSKKYNDLESRIDQMKTASLRFHPTEYDLPLVDPYEKVSSCCYSKNYDDLVVVTISVKSSNGDLKPRIHTIATLPVGFRPAKVISHTISDSLTIRIYKNGTIAYDTTSSVKELSCASILFYAAKE